MFYYNKSYSHLLKLLTNKLQNIMYLIRITQSNFVCVYVFIPITIFYNI